MIEVRKTPLFDRWMGNLRDRRARIRIAERVERLEQGNPGDTRSVGGGVRELRISYGPGYRIYYVQQGMKVVILLCGGDKSTQRRDIMKAREMATEV